MPFEDLHLRNKADCVVNYVEVVKRQTIDLHQITNKQGNTCWFTAVYPVSYIWVPKSLAHLWWIEYRLFEAISYANDIWIGIADLSTIHFFEILLLYNGC
jgi:hypothetical protein